VAIVKMNHKTKLKSYLCKAESQEVQTSTLHGDELLASRPIHLTTG